ncbi:hypothetical protein F2Q68_00019665 [Brassica cretica]|uniref:Uncharacterized protein n=1 Tax=Brassica cretica TaxID=69181 RepID=A0A8S9G176_BRACR|nr:hypothetical protein F2Q68_00019665 [Brassica cretica]
MFVANFQSSSLPLHHHLGLVKDVANACCVADKVSHGGRRGREARQISLVKDVANACCVADEVSHGGRRGREARQMNNYIFYGDAPRRRPRHKIDCYMLDTCPLSLNSSFHSIIS